MPSVAIRVKMLLLVVFSFVFNLFIGTENFCEAPKHPKNGMVTYTTLNVGSELTFVCNNGYHLQDTRPVYCTTDRVWSKADVKCVETAFSPTATPVESAVPERKVTSLENEEQDPPTTPNLTQEINCSCTYNSHDRKLSAEVNGLGLWNGDQVRKGDKMILRCYDPAKRLVLPNATSLSGSLALTCDVCRIWEDSDLPSCQDVGSESCDGEPPSMDNGYPVLHNRSHGYRIYYRCNRYYVKAAIGEVKCSYGQWTGYTPTCIDGRCYVSQLHHTGLEKPPVVFIEDGKEYPATCMKGFKAIDQWKKISCKAGKWNIPAAVCVKESCDGEPPSMDNGYPVLYNRSHGYGIYYRCNKYYVKVAAGNVFCSKGQWTGHTPICIDGRCYVSQLNHPGLETPPVDFIQDGKDYPATCMKGFEAFNQLIKVSCKAGNWNVSAAICVKVDEVTTPASPKDDVRVSRQPENCFCTFNPESEHLVAVVNEQRLENGSPVRKGDSALLYCRDTRLHLLWPNEMRTLAAVNMTCEVCEAWGSNDLPSCELIQSGDFFIVLNENVKVQPGGAVESRLGRNLKIECISWDTNYPDWIAPMPLPVSYNMTRVDEQYTYYQSFIHIENFGQRHAGSYKCSTRTPRPPHRSLRPTKLDLITDCYGEPREILYGRYYIQSRSHKSRVEYECDDSYEMTNPSTVQCLHGKWTGQPPECVKAIPAASVSSVGQEGTYSSNNSTPKPIASKEPSLGGEDECFCTYNNPDRLVSAIYYREQLRYGDKVAKGTWIRLTCVDQVMHLVLPNGTKITTGIAKLTCSVCETWEVDQFPTCETIYYPGLTCPQIVIANDVEVKYSDGRRVGSIAIFNCIYSSFTLVGRNFKCLQNGMWDSNQKPYCQRISVSDRVAPNLPASKESKSEEDCICTYNGNWRLKAVFNGKRIWRGTNITKGESIQLGCAKKEKRLVLRNGTMIVSESVTWTCYRCGAGGASELPTCEEIQLPVVTCPQIEKTEGLTVKYTNERRVYSTATFNCTASFVLYGPSTLHCQQTGIWDRIQPTCRKPEVLCPPILETDVFSVQFTNGRKINSTAHFRCKNANLKIAGGLDTRTCLHFGQWSGTNPDCAAPGCLIGDFIETAPRNLLPSMEGVTANLQPVGSELSMHCEEGWVLIDGKTATCGPHGTWDFGKAQCIVGCQLNIADGSAAPIIKPHKDYYRMGESVIVSCSEGYELTSDVERLLCIEYGWTDKIPNCKEKTNK